MSIPLSLFFPIPASRRAPTPAACFMMLCFGLLATGSALAQSDPQACAAIASDQERLACYDGQFRDRSEQPPAPAMAAASPSRPMSADKEPTLLDRLWQLDAASKQETLRLAPHRNIYWMPLRVGDNPNRSPSSPVEGHSIDEPLPFDAVEAKFQISFKLKARENLFGDNGDLWFGYTQRSQWQVYNKALSLPIRETNYEPEMMLTFHTSGQLFGWDWKMVNFGAVHQSNGRTLPYSRGWSRVYAQFGFERDDFTLELRPWVRLPTGSSEDDNPDIEDYLGNGDVRLSYLRNGHALSALGRYSFTGNRGALQLEWSFPLSRQVNGYVQFNSGYGESLIDYNHSENSIGVGLMLAPW